MAHAIEIWELEPSIHIKPIANCKSCDADLYAGESVEVLENIDAVFCSDSCAVEHLREIGGLSTETIQKEGF